MMTTTHESVLLHAEMFEDYGGWTLDTQNVVYGGLPYLMAHGLGQPVGDAATTVALAAGRWQLWAWTRDWTAAWGGPGHGGRFAVLLDSTPVGPEQGVDGTAWAWHHCGQVTVADGDHRVAVHDLTGFNGRFGGLCFTRSDTAPAPLDWSDGEAVDDSVLYDLVVVGGGYAGTCTALAARSYGLRVLLIEDRGLLGGCNSSEVRVWAGGLTHVGRYPQLGRVSHFISPIDGFPGKRKTREIFEDYRKTARFQEGHDLLLNEAMMDACYETAADGRAHVTAVLTRNLRSGMKTWRRARLFADCTGDGMLARLCGCASMYGREAAAEYGESLAPDTADRQVMGHSVLWEPKNETHDVAFPDIDWGIPFTDANGLKRFNCCWDWETGQYRDQVTEIEYIRDYGLMTVLGNWSWLKNRSPYRQELAKTALEWVSPIGGKRESYRIVGDHIITQCDIEDKVPYDDATAAITWSIDLHFPDPENEAVFGEGFQSCAYHRGIIAPYEVPYRCLYARDADNLFLGGRIISATHIAFSCIRVMRTLGMLGEVVGMAAAICRRHDCLPRDVYASHLAELQAAMQAGVPLGETHAGLPGSEEAYHFMRPVGSVGNSNENVWIRSRQDGSLPDNIPSTILEDIRRLAMRHRNGKRAGE